MRVGISALHVRPGRSGSHEPYMVNLVRGLSEIDSSHHYTIFVTRANRSLFTMDRPSFELAEYANPAENVLARIAMEQVVLPIDALRRRLDVVHYGGTASSFLVRRRDVVTVHHDSISQRGSMSVLRNLYYDAILRLNKRAGLLIVPSQVYGDDLVRYFGYRSCRMRAVHHGTGSAFKPDLGVAVEQARQKWGIEPGAILSVTNTLAHKNIPNLLRAFDVLLARHSVDRQLVLVGNIKQDVLSGVLRDVASNPSAVQSRIRVIPFLPHDQLPPIYGAASLFVFVSTSETFGMPLTEAMACGLPIVASDIPVHREILREGGLTVSPTDPDQIAAAMRTALLDETVRSELKCRALSRAKAFTWRQTALQTVQVYEEAARLARLDQHRV